MDSLAHPLPGNEDNLWTYCAYCNKQFDMEDERECIAQVTQHIRDCEEHPMRRVEQENIYLRQRVMELERGI